MESENVEEVITLINKAKLVQVINQTQNQVQLQLKESKI